MDKRFEEQLHQSNKRFEEQLNQSNKRFEEYKKHSNFLLCFFSITNSILFGIITILFICFIHTKQKQTELIIEKIQNIQKLIEMQKAK